MFNTLGSGVECGQIASKGINVGNGRTFFVSSLAEHHGDDTNEGSDPQYPLATLEAALLAARTRMNDYIFVQDFWTPSAPPLTINKRGLHLIGLSNGCVGNPRVGINGGGASAIQIGADCDAFELAGFEIGGGDDSHDGIEMTATNWKVHMHHNAFGYAIPTRHGIYCPVGVEFAYGTISNNLFGMEVNGWGVRLQAATRGAILNNIFRILNGDGGVYLQSGAPEVIGGNYFYAGRAPDAGWGITLKGSVAGGAIMNNIAGEDGGAPSSNPWVDESAVGAEKLNGWGGNISGIAMTFPA